jgi:ATP-binding cassette, subfamily B, bacterial PglK
MRRLVRQLFLILTPRQRVQAGLLLVLMVVQAAVALLGVASIVPFISIVADPEIIHRNDWLRYAYERGAFASEAAFLTAIGVATVSALVLSNGVSAITTWTTQRFVASANHQLAMRLLRGYLAQPYGFFVQRNSAALNKTILSEVNTAVNGVLMPIFGSSPSSSSSPPWRACCFAVDPLLAVTVVLVLGSAYGLVYGAVRRQQDRLGRIRNESNRLRFKLRAKRSAGSRTSRCFSASRTFIDQFEGPSSRLARANASNAAVSQLPHYFLEGIAFGGIVLIILFYSADPARESRRSSRSISLYALTGYRMLPAIKSLFSSFVVIRFNRPLSITFVQDLVRFGAGSLPAAFAPTPLPFRDEIRLERVTFRYPASSVTALREVSLSIQRNQMVGLVGASGSGKSTLVDLVLGLYEPQSGAITVDGTRLEPRRYGPGSGASDTYRNISF